MVEIQAYQKNKYDFNKMNGRNSRGVKILE